MDRTYEVFIAEFSSIGCLKKLRGVISVEKSLQAQMPSLAKMVKSFGEIATETYIKSWLISLNESLNLKRPLKPHQIDELAIVIVMDYRNVTVSDVHLIFSRAKKGEYGIFYQSISMPEVLQWFTKYFNERCDVAAQMSQRQSEQHKYNAEKVGRLSYDVRMKETRSAVDIAKNIHSNVDTPLSMDDIKLAHEAKSKKE